MSMEKSSLKASPKSSPKASPKPSPKASPSAAPASSESPSSKLKGILGGPNPSVSSESGKGVSSVLSGFLSHVASLDAKPESKDSNKATTESAKSSNSEPNHAVNSEPINAISSESTKAGNSDPSKPSISVSIFGDTSGNQKSASSLFGATTSSVPFGGSSNTSSLFASSGQPAAKKTEGVFGASGMFSAPAANQSSPWAATLGSTQGAAPSGASVAASSGGTSSASGAGLFGMSSDKNSIKDSSPKTGLFAVPSLAVPKTDEADASEGSGVPSGSLVSTQSVSASPFDSGKTWDEIGFPLNPELRRGIDEASFVAPSYIQATALPIVVRDRRNLIAQAKNGSGKTAAFAISILSTIDLSRKDVTQAVIISPTRELAKQNLDVIEFLGRHMGISTRLVVPMGNEGLGSDGSGVDQNSQMSDAQKRAVHAGVPMIASGTPGKVADAFKRRTLKGDSVKLFIVDEADIMVSYESQMGVMVNSVRSFLPKTVQTLLFSATYPDNVKRFAQSTVHNAEIIQLKSEELSIESIWQVYIRADKVSGGSIGASFSGSSDPDWSKIDEAKYNALNTLFTVMSIGQSIIFVNSRQSAFVLAKKLKSNGHSVSVICGGGQAGNESLKPTERDAVLSEFRKGTTNVLIATDVLARGIDVPAVTLVVNFDIPILYPGQDRSKSIGGKYSSETYLHRIGRTGRFGHKGIALTLVANQAEAQAMTDLGKLFGHTVEEIELNIDVLESKLKEFLVGNTRKSFI